jgi:hypothetical protein
MSRRSPLHRVTRAVVAAAVACAAAVPAGAAIVDELSALVDGGRSAEAWMRCSTLEPDQEPRTDLWCGIAAVDVGRAGWGVMALERYALLYPDDPRARLELARAYFYAGDDVRAREEFEAVARGDPPASVRAGIQRYLDALAEREGRYKTRVRAWVEAGAGWDSNANAGVAQADLTLPVLGRVSVVDAAVETSDAFGWLAGRATVDHPVSPGITLHGTVWGNGTFYGDASEFNLGSLGLAAGASHTSGADVYALTYAHGEILLDGSRYRSSDGVGVEWRHRLAERAQVGVAPQCARLDYTGANDVRDADLAAVSLAYRRAWLAAWQPVLALTVFGGDERNRRGRPDLGRTFWGGGADVVMSPSTVWALSAGVSYANSEYDGAIPLLGVTRRDDNWIANVGATYFATRNWSARAEYQYVRNDSNLELYAYTRHVVAARLRYDFK